MDGKVEHEERLIEEFEEMTKNAERIQREILQTILEENSKTEYLQKCLGQKGGTAIDPSSFKACVPLVTYSDVEPYIQRIVAGESSLILTGAPITAFTISSGTTQGRPKTYLFNDEIVDFALQMSCTSRAYRNRDFPIGNGKALRIFYTSDRSQRKGGLPAGVISTNLFRALQQKNRSSALQLTPSSPAEVLLGQEFEETVYCHLLCGLIYRDQVQFVAANFAHNIVHAFRTFEKIWEEICQDIRLGILSNRISSPSVRAAVSKLVLLKPNPELADLIYKICVDLIRSNWSGSIIKLFPNAKYISAIMTGTLQYYSKKLRHYAGNQLPLISGDYVASEAYIGININPKLPPEMVSFTFIPSSAYYEFIPTRKRDSEFNKESRTHSSSTSMSSEPGPVGLTQVEVGKEYEIVITNTTGLYRYRLGDVVKITGFHNSTPQVQFVRRSSSFLCINNDMTTETELDQVVGKASELLADEGLELVDFTSRVDLSTRPGHYVIAWEVNGEANDEIFVECCNLMDRSFGDTHYVLSRKTNDIGALELQVVRSGTLQKIAAHYVGQGASFGQFKMPRCIVTTDDTVLQILSSNLVGTYFSTVYD